jgi:Flp pilus assembly protein TadG
MALELAILFTVIVLLALIITAFGRVGRARSLTDQAAADAARAAAAAFTPGQADQDASRAAADTLSSGGVSCTSMSLAVDTSQFHPGGQVTATVTCRADLSSVALTGAPGVLILTATAGSPIDTFRASP